MNFTIDELINYEINNNKQVQLVNKIHGNGLQLVFICPLATRPAYYLIRVDSHYNFADSDTTIDGRDFTDIVLCMISSEFDEIDLDENYIYHGKNAGKYYRGEGKNKEIFSGDFPMLNITVGYTFDTLVNMRTDYINNEHITERYVIEYLKQKDDKP